MPVVKRKNGWSWGRQGVVVDTKKRAEEIGRAIKASKRRG